MHEVNNAAKNASMSVYFQLGMSRPTWCISRYDNDGRPHTRAGTPYYHRNG